MTDRPAGLGEAATSAAVHTALSSGTRRQLLEALRAAGAPRDAHVLARDLGLHVTTVRFHLEVLLRAGLVHRHSRHSPAVGRPRTVYSSANEPDEERGVTYQELAGILAASLAMSSNGRPERAEEAGVGWAAQLLESAPSGRYTLDDAAAELETLFADMGFDPQLTPRGEHREIALHACPLRDLARRYPDVVCSVHRGLLSGTLGRLGVAATSELQPFVEPELCLAQLSPALVQRLPQP